MRILFVAYRGNMRCGGQGIYLWFLARELARLGHTIDVLVGPPYPDPMPFADSVTELPNDRFWGKWFMKDRAAIIPWESPLGLFDPLRFWELGASWIGFFPEPAAFSVRSFREVARRVRAGERWDVVHDVQCLGWGLLAMRALGLPVLSTVHHPLTVDRRASFRRDRSLREAVGTVEFHPVGMQRFVAQHLDAVITSSHASAAEIRRDFGVRPERLHMLGNGLDTELFSPDPSVARSHDEILCVGRWSDPNKGIGFLVQALAKLPAAKLVLVDEDHPEHDARKIARAGGFEDRIRITGRVETDELVRLYRRAAVVAVPSLYEGFGLPAAEAMACGAPVVAAASGALPEVVETGGGGILVPPADPDGLAKALATLLEQPDARRSLADVARPRRIVDAYSWPRIAARTADLYAELRS